MCSSTVAEPCSRSAAATSPNNEVANNGYGRNRPGTPIATAKGKVALGYLLDSARSDLK